MVESTQYDDMLVSYDAYDYPFGSSDDSVDWKQPMPRIPFTPSFGEKPPMIVGRSQIIGQYSRALCEDMKNMKQPLIVGAIATGKTVLLTQLVNQTSECVHSVKEYLPAQKDMYDLLMSDLDIKRRNNIHSADLSSLDEIDDEDREIKDKINEQHENNEYFDIDLATAIYSCCCYRFVRADNVFGDSGDSGDSKIKISDRLVIAIDDMNPAYIDDIRKIATTVQSLTEIGVNVILIGAGTPENISKIKNDTSATFIDKMDRIDIGNLPIKAAAESIEAVCDGFGIEIDRQVSMAIAKASDGEPFIMQLFAYNACLMAIRRDSSHIHITMDDCYDGFEDGLSTIVSKIVKPTLKTLTAKETEFMKAMSSLYPTSKVKVEDIIKSTGKTKQYINIYKNRLIDKHIIQGDGKGYIKCVIPYMTMYLSDPEKYDNDIMGDMTDMDNDPTEWMRRPIKSTR